MILVLERQGILDSVGAAGPFLPTSSIRSACDLCSSPTNTNQPLESARPSVIPPWVKFLRTVDRLTNIRQATIPNPQETRPFAVHSFGPSLDYIAAHWPALQPHIREAILTLTHSASLACRDVAWPFTRTRPACAPVTPRLCTFDIFSRLCYWSCLSL